MDGKNEFLEMATSLKLVRKAEVERGGTDLINDIYTDNKIERADTKTVKMEMNNGENAGRV